MLELLRNLARHRFVLTNFIGRDLKLKYRGTVLGYLWSLLEPFSLVVVYYFVFVVVARRGGPDYPLVVLLGILPYGFFSAVVTGGASALTANRGLIRRVHLPRELFIAGHAGAQAVIFLLSLLVAGPLMWVYARPVTPGLLLVPAASLGILALATGLALALSCANVLYRDVSYVLKVVLRLGFYGTPVIYPLSLVPHELQGWVLLNPMATFVTLVRSGIMGTPLDIPPATVAGSFIAAAVVFAAGATLFRRWQGTAVKYL